ncbi:MAG: hypothetical protein GOMPHAMPRED_005533 [Gomphillus americanus]|uniref:Uncharacterized protein n=1 Tax=Gomphillus americanus TaxID=1940652 RepID=A0A8H3FVF7_9LECA|nr:MAG: hypothetical protein GOMPHAMPRED_005533 [Gomphillus americanus]
MRIARILLFSAAASASLLDRAVDHFFAKRDTVLVKRDTGSPSNPAIPVSRDPLPNTSDLNTVLSSLQVIRDLTVNSTWIIGNFTGSNITQALAISKATQVIDDATYNATLAIKQIGNLSVSDAEVLGAFSQDLAYAVNASIATLISKKPLFEKLNLATLVVPSLQGLALGSYAFSSTILTKVPQELQTVSTALSYQVIESIAEGIHCFNGTASSCITTIVNPDRTRIQAIENGTINGAPAVKATGWLALVVAVVFTVMAF